MARARALARDGAEDAVLIEGATLAAEAASAGWHIDLVAVTESALADTATVRLVESWPTSTERLLVTPSVMQAMSPVRTPSGLVVIAHPSVPAPGTDPDPGSDPDLGSVPWAGSVPNAGSVPGAGTELVVCAVDVQDPGNLGAIVRVAEAAGATAVLAAGASADPFGWKALRGSMGSAFRLPLARRITLEAALDRARAGRCQIVASVLSGTPLHAVDLSGPTCLFVGSEGRGLPAAVTSAADVRLAIPMERPVESLNVAVAAAVILYEARRQRGAPPGSRR